MFALRNLIRMPLKTLLLFLAMLAIFVVFMWSAFISSACGNAIDREIGFLNGTVRPINETGHLSMSLYRARQIKEDFGIITDLYASGESVCGIEGAAFFAADQADNPNDAFAHTVVACTTMDALESMICGDIFMTEGSRIRPADDEGLKCKVVVSDLLAERSGWKLGDTVRLYWHSRVYGDTQQNFVIGGIYHIEAGLQTDAQYNYLVSANTVFIPLSTYEAVVPQEDSGVRLSSLFFRMEHSNEATVEKLEARLHSMGYYHVYLKRYTPENVVAGIAKLLMLAQVTSMVVVICGLLVFLLIIFLNIQSRKREIGVLISLGKTRGALIRSLFTEVLVIGLAALLCAVPLYYGTASAGSGAISAFFSSDVLFSEFQNTTSDNYFLTLQRHAARTALDARTLLTPVAEVVVLLAAVSLLAFLLLYFYTQRVKAFEVLGDAL